MCRRDAVLYLLRERASLRVTNSKSQTPLDLCNDTWTREAIRSFSSHASTTSDSNTWVFEREDEAKQDVVLPNHLQYEPFFVPRSPVILDHAHKQDFYNLGQLIFNKQPGQGLAFLVASGCTRDYPVDLSFFLRRAKLDAAQVGQFLGESFSLSQTLRLEFINSVKFHGTSVVSGLAKVFTLLQIPPDLQKIDRLVHGVARIWWRQHDKISEEEEHSWARPADQDGKVKDDSESTGDANTEEAELNSFELKQYLVSSETLYQLMFSVIMLHWNLYAPSAGTDEDSRIGMAKWLEINRGLEADGSDIPLHILQRTYRTVRSGFIPQLTIRVSAAKSPLQHKLGSGADSKSHKGSLCRDSAKWESWAWIIGCNFMSFRSSEATKSTQIPSIFSESYRSVASSSVVVNREAVSKKATINGLGPSRPALPLDGSTSNVNGVQKDKVWLSLCFNLLFFSKSCSHYEAPYAFVHLAQVSVERSVTRPFTLALVGKCEVDIEPSNKTTESTGKVVVIFLLPDGRWQEVELTRLEIQVANEEQFEKWVTLMPQEEKAWAAEDPAQDVKEGDVLNERNPTGDVLSERPS